jgi:hypothetical protein
MFLYKYLHLYIAGSPFHLPPDLLVSDLTLRLMPILPGLLLMGMVVMSQSTLGSQPSLRRDRRPNLRECRLRSPSHALTRNLDLRIQLIDLLQRQALRLVDHKPHKGNAEEAAREPDEKDLALQVCVPRAPVHEVWRGVGDRPVQQPVRRGRHGEGFGADLEGEDFTGHHPRNGAPGRGEEEDVDADERDGCLLRAEVLGKDVSVGMLPRGRRAEDRNEELGDRHADC